MTTIALLATGGTIATRDTAEGRAVGVTARELLAATEVPDEVVVTPVDTAGRLSFAATLDDLVVLAAAVRRACAEHDGVVVTHGTDTLEETAALLALTHDGATPVTITGAQRPSDDPEPDGPANLALALRWTAARRRPMVAVAFAGSVWPAMGVRKVHTSALEAFRTPGRAAIATEAEGLVPRGWAAPTALAAVPERLPRVDVVAQYVGADAHAIEAAAAAGARGIVVEAFGAGNATPPVVAAATRLIAEGVPVAVASRTGEGAVEGLYAGGGAELARAGAVFAGDLSPWQARMLLAVAITAHPDHPAGVVRNWLLR